MKSNPIKFRIFCDFDGTVARNDVGNLVFTTFGDEDHWWRLVDEWKQGRIEGREMWLRQTRTLKLTGRQLDAFASTQPLDPHFKDFVAFCRKHDIPLYVCSDGMDAYIERILKAHGLPDLQVRANHLELDSRGELRVDFPYYEFGCGTCANCKGYHVRFERQPDETTIYIGDGLSDVCGALEADIIFAKRDLLKYCHEKQLDCHPFETFRDVQRILDEMLNGSN